MARAPGHCPPDLPFRPHLFHKKTFGTIGTCMCIRILYTIIVYSNVVFSTVVVNKVEYNNDMAINVKKSACLRFGSRYRNVCCEIAVSGHSIKWVESARHLGVYLVSSTNFKCSFSHNKAGFFKAFNSIYGKIGRSASEEVIFLS